MANFYSKLAPRYDQMTRFYDRLEKTANQLSPIVNQYSIKNALDIGCGTGLITCALAKLRVRAAGLDNNSEMLSIANEHSVELNLDISWYNESMLRLDVLEHSFDGVFSLGNTLPHLQSEKQLADHFQQVYDILNPEGIFIFQLVNFEKLERQNQRILSIRKEDDVEMIRFYDFEPGRIGFNILTIDWKKMSPEHELITQTLQSFSIDILEKMAVKAGFIDIHFFENLEQKIWTPESHDIVGFFKKT